MSCSVAVALYKKSLPAEVRVDLSIQLRLNLLANTTVALKQQPCCENKFFAVELQWLEEQQKEYERSQLDKAGADSLLNSSSCLRLTQKLGVGSIKHWAKNTFGS